MALYFDFLANTGKKIIVGLTKEVWNIFNKFAYTDASIFCIKYSEVGMRHFSMSPLHKGTCRVYSMYQQDCPSVLQCRVNSGATDQ